MASQPGSFWFQGTHIMKLKCQSFCKVTIFRKFHCRWQSKPVGVISKINTLLYLLFSCVQGSYFVWQTPIVVSCNGFICATQGERKINNNPYPFFFWQQCTPNFWAEETREYSPLILNFCCEILRCCGLLVLEYLRAVPTIVIAHTFCASRYTWVFLSVMLSNTVIFFYP